MGFAVASLGTVKDGPATENVNVLAHSTRSGAIRSGVEDRSTFASLDSSLSQADLHFEPVLIVAMAKTWSQTTYVDRSQSISRPLVRRIPRDVCRKPGSL
jgi:hypothetical protein